MKNSLLFVFLIISFLISCNQTTKQQYQVKSPNSNVKIFFGVTESGRPYYQSIFNDQMVIDTSYLGFELNKTGDLKNNFQIVSSEESVFDETWEQPWGEEQFIRNNYTQLKVSLVETTELKRKLDIVFRIYDYGVGFRYEFSEQENLKNFEISEELTEFNMVDDHTAWWIPAYEFNRYEYLYKETPLSEMGMVHTPVTFKTKENLYLSIHEAALSDYSSMVIDATQGTRLTSDLVEYSTDSTSTTKVFLSTPSKTPWRTIQMADKPGDLITSYLILNLNEPNQLGDVSWFKPGKYIGIWWELHINKTTWESGERHGATTENTKKYIDFAAKHGFDGVLVEGWNIGWDGDWVANGDVFSFTESYPDYDLTELGRYGKEKGVYIVGHHETSGNIVNYENQMADAFQLYEDNGVKAVKTGYVEHGNVLSNGLSHHGQEYVNHFNQVIKLAASHKIAVVAHEPIKDTGERRTFPNIISREGARGQEFNAWADDGGNPPNHQTIMAFTRYLSGPMDFTPGVFDITLPSKPNNQVNTTLAKQLALYVTVYSPMQMACDLPENYDKYLNAFEFIKQVGVDWETTKVLDAAIGEHVSIARKEKETGDWFVGAITNEHKREVEINLHFLEDSITYEAIIYKDGPNAHYITNPEDYIIEKRTVKSSDLIAIKLAAGGGAAISIKKIANP